MIGVVLAAIAFIGLLVALRYLYLRYNIKNRQIQPNLPVAMPDTDKRNPVYNDNSKEWDEALYAVGVENGYEQPVIGGPTRPNVPNDNEVHHYLELIDSTTDDYATPVLNFEYASPWQNKPPKPVKGWDPSLYATSTDSETTQLNKPNRSNWNPGLYSVAPNPTYEQPMIGPNARETTPKEPTSSFNPSSGLFRY